MRLRSCTVDAVAPSLIISMMCEGSLPKAATGGLPSQYLRHPIENQALWSFRWAYQSPHPYGYGQPSLGATTAINIHDFQPGSPNGDDSDRAFEYFQFGDRKYNIQELFLTPHDIRHRGFNSDEPLMFFRALIATMGAPLWLIR